MSASLIDVPDWVVDASCSPDNGDLFFGNEDERAVAVRICRECPVRPQCFFQACRDREAWGVWGGVTARQRTNAGFGRPLAEVAS